MTSNTAVKSFVDRILRLKEEQDTLSADIRDIYAEAKALGYDKTAMGRVVAHLRKIEKHGRDALDEQDAIFETYLSAYLGTAVATHAHTHEHLPPHDAETGEIVEEPDATPAGAVVAETSGVTAGETATNIDSGSAGAGTPRVASSYGEHEADESSPSNRKRLLRPHCQRPELCRSGTSDHCLTCKRAMQEEAA